VDDRPKPLSVPRKASRKPIARPIEPAATANAARKGGGRRGVNRSGQSASFIAMKAPRGRSKVFRPQKVGIMAALASGRN
jgi:hypothetical protein